MQLIEIILHNHERTYDFLFELLGRLSLLTVVIKTPKAVVLTHRS